VKVALLSDTHGTIDPTWAERFSGCDEIWHAGDFGSLQVAEALQKLAPLRGVYGNIDGPEIRRAFPEHLRFEVEGISIWMTHIGGQPKKYPKEIRQQLQQSPPDLFVCGHSHIVRAERDRFGVFHINPGACGHEGFHLINTAMLLELSPRKVTSLRILEFGPRGGKSSSARMP